MDLEKPGSGQGPSRQGQHMLSGFWTVLEVCQDPDSLKIPHNSVSLYGFSRVAGYSDSINTSEGDTAPELGPGGQGWGFGPP